MEHDDAPAQSLFGRRLRLERSGDQTNQAKKLPSTTGNRKFRFCLFFFTAFFVIRGGVLLVIDWMLNFLMTRLNEFLLLSGSVLVETKSGPKLKGIFGPDP